MSTPNQTWVKMGSGALSVEHQGVALSSVRRLFPVPWPPPPPSRLVHATWLCVLSFAWKKSQARACQNPAEIVHFRTAKFIAVFGEHQKSKEGEVDNVNPGHHETPVPAAGRVVFRGTEVGFSAASIANTAQHKPASPAARCACYFR